MCPAPRSKVLGIATEAPKQNETNRCRYQHREMDALQRYIHDANIRPKLPLAQNSDPSVIKCVASKKRASG